MLLDVLTLCIVPMSDGGWGVGGPPPHGEHPAHPPDVCRRFKLCPGVAHCSRVVTPAQLSNALLGYVVSGWVAWLLLMVGVTNTLDQHTTRGLKKIRAMTRQEMLQILERRNLSVLENL